MDYTVAIVTVVTSKIVLVVDHKICIQMANYGIHVTLQHNPTDTLATGHDVSTVITKYSTKYKVPKCHNKVSWFVNA